jgi:asparagine synthase (glutamine-hydrolysing)
MCGIAGLIRFDGQTVPPEPIERMTSALAHRGPDGQGTVVHGPVALGHRRLAIIDLEGGRQPMSNESGDVWITFNGEIYNFQPLRRELESAGHRFATCSDTEVIVHAYEQWGDDCVSRLRGMFAFGLLDLRKRRLLLARDHFGVKPLFYRVTPQMFAFASELGAIRQAAPSPPPGNILAVDLFLQYQYIPAPHTIYRDTFKLPPAHTLALDLDRPTDADELRPRRYWQLRFTPQRGQSEEQWLQRLDRQLTAAVETSLVSDVPFGVFLSGGVDSTLVAWKMRELLQSPVRAFTIGFPEERYSEAGYAKEAADVLGLEWHAETVAPDAVAVLPELVDHYGEPFGDSSAVPTWYLARLGRAHVPMVLSGDGCDELFGGYETYRTWMQQTPGACLGRLIRAPSPGGLRDLSAALWEGAAGPSCRSWERLVEHTPLRMRAKLWRPEWRAVTRLPHEWFEQAARTAPRQDRLAFAQHLDMETYLPHDILTKVDVAAMAHGLEVRPALLNVELAELAASMPLAMRMRRGADGDWVGKPLLKRLLGQRFPRELAMRPKMGFYMPRNHWFLSDQPLGRRLAAEIADPRCPLARLFEPTFMQRLLESHSERCDQSAPLWLLLVLGTWLARNPDVSFEQTA